MVIIPMMMMGGGNGYTDSYTVYQSACGSTNNDCRGVNSGSGYNVGAQVVEVATVVIASGGSSYYFGNGDVGWIGRQACKWIGNVYTCYC